MKANLLMDFSVDKKTNKIFVKREFAAPLPMVWKAWTTSDILDQWWAPRPWKTNTRDMKFKEGGHWLYAMVGPDGTEHLCKADFKTIQPETQFTVVEGFCDAAGKFSEDLPLAHWLVEFHAEGNSTIVDIEITYDKLSDLETIIKMGFREGFTAALANLDELF